MLTVTMRSNPAPTVVVNDAIIASTDIAREVQNHAGATPLQAWQEATRALVVRELLLQRARALNVVAQPLSQDGARETDEEALISALLAAEVTTPRRTKHRAVAITRPTSSGSAARTCSNRCTSCSRRRATIPPRSRRQSPVPKPC